MEYVFRTWSDNEHYDGDCSFGVVDLTKEFLENWIGRAGQVKRLQQEDYSLYYMVYWNSLADFFGESDDDDPPTEFSDQLTAITEQAQSSEDFIPLGDVKVDDFIRRTECDQISVSSDGIRFRAIPKWAEFYVESPLLTVGEMQKILDQFDAVPPGLPKRTVLLDEPSSKERP